jgi:hypothetical protein
MFDLTINAAHASVQQMQNIWNFYKSFVNLKWASDPADAFAVLIGK